MAVKFYITLDQPNWSFEDLLLRWSNRGSSWTRRQLQGKPHGAVSALS